MKSVLCFLFLAHYIVKMQWEISKIAALYKKEHIRITKKTIELAKKMHLLVCICYFW